MLRAQDGHPCKDALSELTTALTFPDAAVDEWTRSLAEDMRDLNVSISDMKNSYKLHKAYTCRISIRIVLSSRLN